MNSPSSPGVRGDAPTAVQEALAAALALHRQGKRELAMQRYVTILQQDPKNLDALYYVAALALQEGQTDEGIRVIRRALDIGPPQARLHNLLGQAQLRKNQDEEALKSFGSAIECDTAFVDAYGNRATLLAEMNRFEEALADYDRALTLRPDNTEDICNRAGVLIDLGRQGETLADLDRVIARAPTLAPAYFNRGRALALLGRHEEALANFDRTIALFPKMANAYNARALALKALDRLNEALASVEHALALDSNSSEAYSNRGNILRSLGRNAEALTSHDRAIALKPNLALSHLGRALALLGEGRVTQARSSAETAFRLDPASPEIVVGLAHFQLLDGDWQEGWKNYEYRAQTRTPAYHPLPYPRWHGESLSNGRLLVFAEQAMGDAIQFCRFAQAIAQQGNDVTILTSAPLARLFNTLQGVRIVTSTKAAEQSGQPIHWVPMMSLPGILGHSPDTIPKQIPYLSAEPDRVALWGDWLGTNGFRIGINWNSGQPMDGASAGSDISLHEFSSLAAIPGVRLISLQGGAGSGQVAQVPFSARIEQPTQGFNAGSDAFIDTAAMMMSLDLIVTCDTSIAHLAGALGRTVFTALPHVADWRWLRDSDDTPWYPTMRLFRQTKPGDWSDVFARIATAVAERASAQQR